MCTHNICFELKYEKSKKKKNQLKIVIFTAVINRCLLHGRVFVMNKSTNEQQTKSNCRSMQEMMFKTEVQITKF